MKLFRYMILLSVVVASAISLTNLVGAYDDSSDLKTIASNKQFPITAILHLLLSGGEHKDILTNNDGPYSLDEDEPLAIAAPGVLANDLDTNGHPAVLVQNAGHGTVSLDPAGSFTYTPNNNFWGPDSFTYKVIDGSYSSNVASVSIWVNPINDAPIANAGSDKFAKVNEIIILDGSGSADAEDDPLTYTWVLLAKPPDSITTLTNANSISPSLTPDKEGPYTIELVVNDTNFDSVPDSVTITATALPPDPATVAPEIDPTVATTTYEATEFLYTGNDPIQTGVEEGTIDPLSSAVIRGKVMARDGNPLPGVIVTILNHPEFGQTYSRNDGMFDLAVNGGETLVVNYAQNGYLTLQRKSDIPILDFTIIPEVVMTRLDAQTTTVDLNQAVDDFVVAEGSVTSDDRGTRKSTLLFPLGTQAEMKFADGSTQSISTLTVRMTEYSTGEEGQDAMPAPLPTGIGYTYCVEMSVDEAESAGATTVIFDTPLINYVENFLGFAVGEVVPSYYYDRTTGKWVSTTDGVVIKILGTTDNKADLDTDGDGNSDDAATLTALGIIDVEREYLANLYQNGTELWRVLISHFSPVDYNWPVVFSAEAVDPDLDLTEIEAEIICESTESSVIKCQSQVLGESIPIFGTPLSLNYRSSRTEGDARNYTLDIPLTKENWPSILQEIRLRVYVAGQSFEEVFTQFSANMSHRFVWDGMDVYARKVYGSQPITVSLTYIYEGYYEGSPSITFPASKTVYSQDFINTGIPNPLGTRGWSFNVHHNYDPRTKTLYLGNGETQKAKEVLSGIITTVAGNGGRGYSGDGGPATEARLYNPWGVSVASDGTIYIADTENHVIRKVATNGIITTVAGNGVGGYSGDGGPATEASLYVPEGVSIAPDGNLYIAGYGNDVIRKVDTNGIITTVAGNGNRGGGDGGPATEAGLDAPVDVSIAVDGSLYIAEFYGNVIRKVDPSGIITTVAGNGSSGYSGDGGPATEASLHYPMGVSVAPDGIFYIAGYRNPVIRKVDTDGIITTVAGNGNEGYSGDGGPATEASLSYPHRVSVAPNGTFYIADSDNNVIRKVDTEGIITTVAGNRAGGYSGDGGPATEASLNFPRGMSIIPDGDLYIADTYNYVIRKVELPTQLDIASSYTLPSSDGSEIYQFDGMGRHLETLNALTNAVLYEFTYDADGLLAQLIDGDGNTTSIERDVEGNPTAIVSPYGQRTTLSLDGNSYLSEISNPGNETWHFVNSDKGLLTSAITPHEHTSTYQYDGDGALIKATDAAGGSQSLQRTEIENGYEVSRTTQMNRTTSYRVENLENDVQRLLNTAPNGLSIESLIEADGTQTTTHPDGTIVSAGESPDPRFGMLAPYTSSMSMSTPGGRSLSLSRQKSVTLADESDPFSLQTQTEKTTINGHRIYTRIYDATAHTMTLTSPQERNQVTTLNTLGQVVSSSISGITPISISYDANGRIHTLTHGIRLFTINYGSNGYISSVSDPLGRTITYTRDTVGRMTVKRFSDGREIQLGYDEMGNITSITPPSRPAHSFSYSLVDKLENYTPPTSEATTYTYNADRQVTQVQRPNTTMDIYYDSAGRIFRQSIPGKSIDYIYNPATGQLAGLIGAGETLGLGFDGTLPTRQSWSGTVTGSVIQSHNDDFRVVSRSVNGSNTITFGYDQDGLLTQVGSLVLTRNAGNGLITATALGSLTDSRNYNSFGETSDYTVSYNAAAMYAATYTRDDIGRITQKSETLEGVNSVYTYAYDTAGRLSRVNKDGTPVESYSYDANGNRLSANGTSATYDNQDRLNSFGAISYAYTGNGELLTKSEGTNTTSYTYDFFGNLKTVVLDHTTLIEYIVDAANRRIGKKVAGMLAQGFLYKDGLNPVAELDGSGAVVSRFVYGSKRNIPDYMLKGGNTYRIISDHLGSPRLVVDTANGTIAQRINYDTFGNITNDTAPGFQPFGFAGGLYDTQTKLTRFGVRDYDAQAGRWTAKDPILFAGLSSNLYSYTFNDPVNYIDPDGKINLIGAAVIIGAGVAIIYYADTIAENVQNLLDRLVQANQANQNVGNMTRNDEVGEVTEAGIQMYNDYRNNTAACAQAGATLGAEGPHSANPIPTGASDLIGGEIFNETQELME